MDSLDRRAMLVGTLATAGVAAMHAPSLAAKPKPAVRLPVDLFEMTMNEARSQRRMRLLADAMGKRVVALNFMFTGCSSVCPMQSTLLSRTQKLMAPRMGRDVVFLSISISPLGDTPKKLRAFAKNHGAGPGWLFLAGDFVETNRLQKAFEAYEARRDDHPPVICIGKASSTRWSRLYGMPRPDTIARELNAWL
ncbi:MAG: SCO family protein [Erythrobacter sp.]